MTPTSGSLPPSHTLSPSPVPGLVWQRVLEHPQSLERGWGQELLAVPTIPSAGITPGTPPKGEFPSPLPIPAVCTAQGFSRALGAQEGSITPVGSIPSPQQHQGWRWGGRRVGSDGRPPDLPARLPMAEAAAV